MTIWQFKIELIPQRWLDLGGDAESLFGEGGYDACVAWDSYDSWVLEERLGSLLPPGKSWNAALTLWGSEQTDDIQLWCRQGAVESVGVRFDLRNPNMALFRKIVDVAQESKLAILVPDHRRVVAADLQSLLRAAAESDAAHFTLDPHSFLSRMDAANVKAT